MNEIFVIVDDDSKIVDRCFASSLEEANNIFERKGIVDGDILSEADFMREMQLNSLESQL